MQSESPLEQEQFVQVHEEASRALRRLRQAVEDRASRTLTGVWALGDADEVRACGERQAARIAEIVAAQLVVRAAGADGLTPAQRAQIAVLLGL